MPDILINHSGKSGQDGVNGSSSGEHGSPGVNGTDAKDTAINLTFHDERAVVDDLTDSTQRVFSAAELPDLAISIAAIGGNGGAGGYGAIGATGRDGMNGASATSFSAATNGQDGGPGGPGGNGGSGGSAGDGGDIRVQVKDDDTDLLMLVGKAYNQGGKGGLGGKGGAGGRGGYGGRGGSGYSWTDYESRLETQGHTVYLSNGQSRYETRLVTVRHAIQRSRPAGSSGSNGAPGRSGFDGANGKNGIDGEYCILVTDLGQSYPGRYDLSVTSFNEIKSPDGVIEPYESLALTGLTVKNVGFMPTPSKWHTQFSIQSSPWIEFLGPMRELDAVIEPGGSYTLPKALNYRIKPNLQLWVNQVPRERVALKWHALMPRVNKLFTTVEDQKTEIWVEYPVNLSLIRNPEVITLAEEAPFAVKINNISNVALGRLATVARSLQLKFVINSPYNNLIEWRSADGTKSQIMDKPLIIDYDRVAANSSVFFSGTLKFTDISMPLYTPVNWQMDVMLGHYLNPLADTTTVQINATKFQLAEAYVFDPEADFVLVTHAGTSHEEVEKWQVLATALGTKLGVWNASLYNGIDFAYQRKGGGSFLSQLSGKVVIILNQNFHADHKDMQLMRDYTHIAELYHAAQAANIATYVVGQAFDLFRHTTTPEYLTSSVTDTSSARLPLLSKAVDAERFSMGSPIMQKTIVTSYSPCFGAPTEEALEKEAYRLQEELHRKYPHQQHFVAYHYKFKLLESGCFANTAEIGTIRAWKGLGSVAAKLAARTQLSNESKVDNVDIFNILKLLPFRQKLMYLDRGYRGPYKNLIVHTILSDLADEQYAWRQHTWSGDYPKDRLCTMIACANTIANFQFTAMKSDAIGQKVLLNLIMHFEYLITKLPSYLDYFLFYRRGRILTEICNHTVRSFLQKNCLAIADKIISESRSNIATLHEKRAKEQLLFMYLNPSNDCSTLFHHSCPTVRVERHADIPSASVTPKNIQESTYLFAGGGVAAERSAAIKKFEQQCHS